MRSIENTIFVSCLIYSISVLKNLLQHKMVQNYHSPLLNQENEKFCAYTSFETTDHSMYDKCVGTPEVIWSVLFAEINF